MAVLIDTYSLGQLQDMRAALSQAAAAGLTAAEVHRTVEARIERLIADREAMEQHPATGSRQAGRGESCPQCSQPLTVGYPAGDGQVIDVCRACRWSRYAGEVR